MDIFTILGYLGSFVYITAFVLLQMRKIDSGLTYTILNMIGALLLGISLFVHFNEAALFIQVVWFAISIFGIYKILKYRPSFHSVHLVFDLKSKELPTHFILFNKDKQIEHLLDYNDTKVWNYLKDSNICLEQHKYFSLYEDKMDLKHNINVKHLNIVDTNNNSIFSKEV